MLSGEGKRRRTVKNNNRSNQQKSNFARAAHFFFLHFFAVVLHDYNVKLPEASQLHVLCRGFFWSLFFSLPLIFTLHWWPLAFLILLPPLQNNFMLFFQQNVSFNLFFISRTRSLPPFFSLSFAGLPPTFSFSRSCCTFQNCGRDN